MSTREVTERDFRMPEFRDAKPEEYEFRDDGKIVRKDRWMRGIHSIRSLVGNDAREFEIEDVISAVRRLVEDQSSWLYLKDIDEEELPSDRLTVDVRLNDGSILHSAEYAQKDSSWMWRSLDVTTDVVAWREPLKQCD